ncbi:MAG: mechanosensitive ion channel [Bacteroidia bacterium]|nr:mechanosensitive ion channel [Bacteroidia bacterium]
MFQLISMDITPSDTLFVLAESMAGQLVDNPASVMQTLGQKVLDFGVKVIAALLIYIIGAWLIKKVRGTLRNVMARRKLEASLSSFIMSLTTITLYIVLIILAISALGVNTTSLAALLAAGGVAIGAALSGTMQNFAGGLMLMIFKPFKAGDFISAQGYSGTVSDVSIFSTRIITTDNREITIPNGALSNSNIDNYSAKPIRRIEWKISVEYGSDADAFDAAVKDILSGETRIIDSSVPGAADPFVALSSLNDSNISFVIRVWVNSQDYWNVYFDGLESLYSELTSRGFSFAYPHMDVVISEQKNKASL